MILLRSRTPVSLLYPACFAAIVAGCVATSDSPANKQVQRAAEDSLASFAVAPAAPTCRSAQQLPDPDAPDIGCPAPPNTFDVSSFFAADASVEAAAQAGPTWDAWAWASFAAMNWPAKKGGPDDSKHTGYIRGVPDLTTSFANAAADDVLVWETFKEKRELFNTGNEPIVPAPQNPYPSSVTRHSKWQELTYATAQQVGSGVPVCTGAKPLKSMRFFAQRAKAANYTDLTETDETVEVASQACEKAAVLCAGLPTTSVKNGPPSYSDCVNNIFPGTPSSTVCEGQYLDQRTPVGPRVWKGDPGTDDSARPLYFEVKLNYDFWAYILEKGYYLDKNVHKDLFGTIETSTRSDHPKLPFRTSAGQGPGRSPNAVFGYDAAKVSHDYSTLAKPNKLPGIGSIQLKAGWLALNEQELASQQVRPIYHTSEGYYFKSEEKSGGGTQTCAQPATFGLVGLHIIQRVHSLAPQNREENFSYGGTFVFATWEHVGLGNYVPPGQPAEPTGYYYANYLAFDTNFYPNGPPGPVDPGVRFDFRTQDVPFPYWKAAKEGRPAQSAIPVVRMKPYPLATTSAVNNAAHKAITARNPDSVWTNYRLIGTQFFAADLGPADAEGRQPTEKKYNQPYYLANLVVETNTDLQNFHGLPPGVEVTPYYTDKVGGKIPGKDSRTLKFQRADDNVIFNRQNIGARNMGGCMGCHGVAQLKGFNFSFVFAGGQTGSGLDTQDEFAVAGGQDP